MLAREDLVRRVDRRFPLAPAQRRTSVFALQGLFPFTLMVGDGYE
mgnify:FL=1